MSEVSECEWVGWSLKKCAFRTKGMISVGEDIHSTMCFQRIKNLKKELTNLFFLFLQ